MSAGVTAEPPVTGAPTPEREPGEWRRYAVAAGFLAPAGGALGVWIVYPAVYPVVRGLFARNRPPFLWGDNYKTPFSAGAIRTPVKNNPPRGAPLPPLWT